MSNTEMKLSGIDYIGEIPKDFSVFKTKHICSITTGNKDTINRNDDGVYPFFVRSPKVERIDTYSFDGEAVLTAGDGDVGEIFHYINGKFDYHQRVYKFSNFNKIDGRFFYYYILSNFKFELGKYSAKTTVESLRLPWLLNYPIVAPCVAEQKVIVNFLDNKCSNIDNIINDLERQIEILEKYKKSVITEAVTKGLNPDVELKESGVEWIGKIPVNWKVRKLKYVLSSPLQYGANETGIDFSDELPRYIRITDISLDNKLKEEGKLSLDFNVAKQYILKHNDILFARSGATVGKTFLYLESYGLCCFAGYLIRANINNKIVFPKYVYYTTLGNGYENWKDKVFSQATIQNIGADKYNLYKLPVPTLEEQVDIVNHIDSKCFEIDSIIEDKKTQVETIKKYKNSLIYEYVTGKKRVSQGDVNE